MKKPYIPEGCDQQGRRLEELPEWYADLDEYEKELEKEMKLLIKIFFVAIFVVLAVTLPHHFLNF
jgi:hypothetical protein